MLCNVYENQPYKQFKAIIITQEAFKLICADRLITNSDLLQQFAWESKNNFSNIIYQRNNFIAPDPEMTFEWRKYSTKIASVTRKKVPGTFQKDWPVNFSFTSVQTNPLHYILHTFIDVRFLITAAMLYLKELSAQLG